MKLLRMGMQPSTTALYFQIKPKRTDGVRMMTRPLGLVAWLLVAVSWPAASKAWRNRRLCLLLLLLTRTGVHLMTSNSSANTDYSQILVVMLRTIRWRLRDLRVLVIGLKALNTQNTPFLSSWCSGQSVGTETVNT
jgi:hypothetical protein